MTDLFSSKEIEHFDKERRILLEMAKAEGISEQQYAELDAFSLKTYVRNYCQKQLNFAWAQGRDIATDLHRAAWQRTSQIYKDARASGLPRAEHSRLSQRQREQIARRRRGVSD